MNFNFYIIGTPNGIYKQIPDDYIASEITGFQKGLKGKRLVIMRKMNLMHYIYMEKIDSTKFIGFCLIFNKAYVARPKQLIALFQDLIEDYLVNKGDIIRYSQKGELQYAVDSFNQNVERYKKLNLLIKEKFENQTSLYGIHELSTIFNGEHSSRIVGIDLEEEQLLQMSFAYNTLIIDGLVGIEQAYIPKIISDLRRQINTLTSEIGLLTQQNAKLKRQKKQFTIVFILIIIIAIGAFLFYHKVNSQNEIIQRLEQKNEVLDTHRKKLQKDSIKLTNTLATTKEALKRTEKDLGVLQSEYSSLQTKKEELYKLSEKQKNTINQLNTKISNLERTVTNLRNNSSSSNNNSVYSIGASKNLSSKEHDSTFAMWVQANRNVTINSFVVHPNKSGYITIGLYKSSGVKVGTHKTYVYANQWNTISPYFKLSSNNIYYLAIEESNGISLSYHKSSYEEYKNYKKTSLDLLGFSSKGKSDYGTGYYQYFYDITYTRND